MRVLQLVSVFVGCEVVGSRDTGYIMGLLINE